MPLIEKVAHGLTSGGCKRGPVWIGNFRHTQAAMANHKMVDFGDGEYEGGD